MSKHLWWCVLSVGAVSAGSMVASAQCGSWVPGFGVPGMNGAGVNTAGAWDPDGAGPLPPSFVVAGAFTSMNGVTARNLAKFDPATNLWSGFGDVGVPGVEVVYTVASAPNGDLLVGGSITSVNSLAVGRIARFNGTTWFDLGGGVSGGTPTSVRVILPLPNGDIIAGGRFTTAGAAPAANIARWNGTSWSALGSGTNGDVLSLARLPNGDIIAGGSFTSAAGVPNTSRIARWNGSSWSAMSNGSTSDVRALAVLADGTLIAPVNFSGSNGLCRWTGSAWVNYSGGPITNTIYALAALPDGGFVVGGVFSGVGSLSSPTIVRRSGSAWAPMNSVASGGVFGLAFIPPNDLFAAGAFSSMDGSPAGRIARHTLGPVLSVIDPPDDTSAAPGSTVSLISTPAPGFANVSVRWQRNGVNVNNGVGGASVGGGTVSGALANLTSPTNGSPATLTITNVQASDAGTYTAVFTGTCGGVTSAPAVVTVSAQCVGDFNNDGFVDDFDFVSFAVAYNILDCGDPAMPPGCPADLNGDGFVDDDDFVLFANAYNELICP